MGYHPEELRIGGQSSLTSSITSCVFLRTMVPSFVCQWSRVFLLAIVAVESFQLHVGNTRWSPLSANKECWQRFPPPPPRRKIVLKAFNSPSSAATDAVTSKPLPPAISVEGLTCTHDGGGTYQLQDVSYVLPRGGKVGLVGRNGCGKVSLSALSLSLF